MNESGGYIDPNYPSPEGPGPELLPDVDLEEDAGDSWGVLAFVAGAAACVAGVVGILLAATTAPVWAIVAIAVGVAAIVYAAVRGLSSDAKSEAAERYGKPTLLRRIARSAFWALLLSVVVAVLVYRALRKLQRRK